MAALVGLILVGLAVWLPWRVLGKPSGGGPKPASSSAPADRPLAGKVVVLDPGHNVGNRDHIHQITQLVQGSTRLTGCDDTGTSTNDGYAEAAFTMDVTRRAAEILSAQGATVKLTHQADRPWGPCVDERARIGNEARADAVVSIHADGAAAGARGFHVLLPDVLRKGRADTAPIVAPSRRLGELLAAHFARATAFPPANYVGDRSGLMVRKNLAGLNLSKVPVVFIECGNMRNAVDARQLEDPSWRGRAAQGIAGGISGFLGGPAR
ncbi:hypothetical protein GCM10012280_34790 [Wenjunlia tyrosinilytica]|uniref:MurNAc-LAA domain-containing protein n=1 Tax=Wenjunlia tyrosinilytica TaxID=1544741 RepID=A0A918DY99_9ACTN|nr:hypothetical protein GCM10012280_34790 [Wenjunlia tyrosinilytica]